MPDKPFINRQKFFDKDGNVVAPSSKEAKTFEIEFIQDGQLLRTYGSVDGSAGTPLDPEDAS